MAALTASKKAPAIVLPTVDGNEFSLAKSLKKGPVVLAFFKVSCPVCQYAFPYIERLFKKVRGRDVTIVGVSQDNPEDTKMFLREFGITFPVAIDDSSSGYKVSNAYGLTTVPTTFEIDPDGTIAVSSVSWSRPELEEIYVHLMKGEAAKPPALFERGEQVSEYRIG